ncbi:hypothetical protein WS67_21025 [Burkholderia singularis]|uniref:N-acetyltransferase domain-containing protein n=1 Tax=Burkholderia singularis TaxID=1503053 RepID=A0A103DXY2_9BURK|nr:GNAT family N-acetyltransferase [Burkholderia singularis]KVE24580.1 hypothetical protein WS67_21025 [Burkholderia singularis]
MKPPGAWVTLVATAQDLGAAVRLADGSSAGLRARLLERLKCDAAEGGRPHDECTLEVAALVGADGIVAGGITGSLLYGRLYVDLIHVDECFRGRGLGERLLRHAEGWAREKGASHVWLHTYRFQAPGFYRRCGYAELATIGETHDPQAMTFFAKRIG